MLVSKLFHLLLILVGKTKDSVVHGYYSLVQLDTALMAEGTLHDGVQGQQGDRVEDVQG